MKRIVTVLIIALMLMSLLTSCGDGTTPGGSASGPSDITVSDPVFGFVSEEEYEETGVVDMNKKITSLDVDTSYFLFMNFEISSARNNDGQSLLNVKITFDALDIMEGTIEDVSTGMISEISIENAETGKTGKQTTVSFKIPPLSSKPKAIEMIIKLKPLNVGESHIIIDYDYNTEEECKILGSDGYTKNLKINRVQIEAPVININERGTVEWNHVKNAVYYMIYDQGSATPIKDYDGKDIVISAEGYSVGSNILFNIGEYITGYHSIVVRAFTNNPNIDNSDYSNAEEHMW